MDSESMRLAATRANQLHSMAISGSEMMVAGALFCGMILMRAKRCLPHGAYLKWQKQYLSGIPERTLRRYLNYAEAITVLKKKQIGHVADLLLSNPEDFTEANLRAIAPKVRQLTSGKTFAELGRELGIVKERDTPSRKAERRHSRDTGHKPTDYARYAAEWTDELQRLAPQAEQFENYIQDEDLNRVVAAIRQIAVGLQIPFELIADPGE